MNKYNSIVVRLVIAVSAVSFCSCLYFTSKQPSSSKKKHQNSGLMLPQLAKVPAGRFLMGQRASKDCPASSIYVDEFFISKYEVTNREFELFVDDTGYRTSLEKYPYYAFGESGACPGCFWKKPYGITPNVKEFPDLPVVFISFIDAQEYCRWLSQKTKHEFRLPSEAEWEKAARGCLVQSRYPWGNDDRSPQDCHLNKERPKPTGPIAVGTEYSPNTFGIYNMSGNVREICNSLFMPYPYNAGDGRENPHTDQLERQMKGMAYRTIRGGWYGSEPTEISSRSWTLPLYAYRHTGFRLATSTALIATEENKNK